MMQFSKSIKLVFLLLMLVCTLITSVKGELRWTKEDGWSSESGITSLFMANTADAKNGIDLLNRAKQYEEVGEYFKALMTYRKVYKKYPTSELAPQAYFQEAQIYTKRRQYAPAFKSYSIIIKKYGDYAHYNQVIRQQFEVACLLMQGKRPYYWGLIPGFKDYDSAIKYFETVIDNAPFNDLAPQALMNIALVAQEHGKPEQVIDALERLIYTYPKNDFTEEAYLLLAQTHANLVKGPSYDQAPTRQAFRIYEDFLATYPQSQYVAKAEEGALKMLHILAASRLELGDFYYQYRNNNKAALVLYNDAITVDPDSDCAVSAKKGIQRIKDKELPPSTIVDKIFGRYEPPPYEDDLT